MSKSMRSRFGRPLLAAGLCVLSLVVFGCANGDDAESEGKSTTSVGSESSTDVSGKPAAPVVVEVDPSEGHVTAGSAASIEVTTIGPDSSDAELTAEAAPVATVSGGAPEFAVSATGSGEGTVTFIATAGATVAEEVVYVSADELDVFWSSVGHNEAAAALLDARLARGAITSEQHEAELRELEGGGVDEQKIVTPPGQEDG
jgi:hypothetical protein